jgi:ABC-2 type transport system ATP-binding protein
VSAIEVVDLTRGYRAGGRRGAERPAVRGLTFDVRPGELFGLLGPNGAGKTTTIKILCTLLLPTTGRAVVLGHDVVADPVAVRRRIGYVAGGDKGLYDRLSARDNLRYFAELHGITGRDQRVRVAELLDLVGLTDRAADRVERFSRGMRQRLHIARGLLNRPDVLFLDEPTLGLDPEVARQLRRTIADLAGQGTTVLLTTHYMHEADELCARIALVNEGRLVALDTPARLKEHVADRTVVTVAVRDLDEPTATAVRALPGVLAVEIDRQPTEQLVTVQAADTRALLPELLRHLADAAVIRVDTREPTLEDAYVSLLAPAGAGG